MNNSTENSKCILSSVHHSFDMALAKKFGVQESVLLHHFMYWIGINKRAGRNFHDGRYWMYQTREEMALHFPYWTHEEVKYLCEKLVKTGILVVGNYNKSKWDKTNWYAFSDEVAFGVSNNSYEEGKVPDRQGIVPIREEKTPRSIPDTIPDTKKDITQPSSNDGDDLNKSFKRGGLSDTQVERAVTYYKANEERLKKEKKNPIGYVVTIIKNDGDLSEMRLNEIVKERRMLARKREYSSNSGYLQAFKDGVEIVSGSIRKFIRYDEEHSFWDSVMNAT